MTAAIENTSTAPYGGIVRRLSRKAADAEAPGIEYRLNHATSLDRIDDWVIGVLGLGRGAVFVQDENVASPFMCAVTAAGRRTHAVVAREYGDVSWPAFIAKQRRTASVEGRIRVQRGLADVRRWLWAGEKLRAAYEAAQRHTHDDTDEKMEHPW